MAARSAPRPVGPARPYYDENERRDIAKHTAEMLAGVPGVNPGELASRIEASPFWHAEVSNLVLPRFCTAITVIIPRNRHRAVESLSRVPWLKPLLVEALRAQVEQPPPLDDDDDYDDGDYDDGGGPDPPFPSGSEPPPDRLDEPGTPVGPRQPSQDPEPALA